MFKSKAPTFTSADIEAQLSQVHPPSLSRSSYLTESLQITLDPTNTTHETLEPLAPLLKTLQETNTSNLYLQALDAFVLEKEHEIERICNENYQDFVEVGGMVGRLREGTGQLKGQIAGLDEQMGAVGLELSNKVSTIPGLLRNDELIDR